MVQPQEERVLAPGVNRTASATAHKSRNACEDTHNREDSKCHHFQAVDGDPAAFSS